MPGATSYGWRQAIDGGGFQNAFDVADNAVHTSYPNSALSGADVAGIHYTKTRQANCIWIGANRGQIGWPPTEVSRGLPPGLILGLTRARLVQVRLGLQVG